MNYELAAKFRPLEQYIKEHGVGDVVFSSEVDDFFKSKGVNPKLGVRFKREAERFGFVRLDPKEAVAASEFRVNGLRCRGVYVHSSVPENERVEMALKALFAQSKK